MSLRSTYRLTARDLTGYPQRSQSDVIRPNNGWPTASSAFNKKIANFQLVQEMLADISTAITTSRLLCYYALSCIDRGERANHVSAMAKRYAVSNCQRAISLAMEVHGAIGLSREMGIEQLYRDARMLTVPDGTTQILTLIEGRELTGLPAYR